MASERPILFSGPMVRALLEGRKTQTRRVIKHPHASEVDAWDNRGDGRWEMGVYAGQGAMAGMGFLRCPYGVPGDRLWVRETWAEVDSDDPPPVIAYRADDPDPHSIDGSWRPSIYMFRRYSRLTLEVVRVAVHRLHDISEEDARAEGVTPAPFCKAGRPAGQEHVEAFEDIWRSINGPASWDANPWVWAISFKRLTP